MNLFNENDEETPEIDEKVEQIDGIEVLNENIVGEGQEIDSDPSFIEDDKINELENDDVDDANDGIEGESIDDSQVNLESSLEDGVENIEELGSDEFKAGEQAIEGESEDLSKEEIEKQLREYQKNLIEAALYAAGKPLNVEIISTKLEISKKIVNELINELAFDYLERSTALVINQVGDSYQMAIKSEYVERISKFASGGAIAEKYLRTLTIIALKQPILKSMVIKLRGSGAYEHVKYLIDNNFITAVKKGRSHELTTTDQYAEMFGLPKDKSAMKQMMISQLGLGDDKNNEKKE